VLEEIHGEGGRAAAEAAMAARVGVPTGDSSHLAPLLAGSNVGTSAYRASASSPPRGWSGAGGGGGGGGGGVAPVGSLADYKSRADGVIAEYLVEAEEEEAALAFSELGAPFFAYEFVRRLLRAAMERENREREMASRLLSSLYGRGALSMEAIGKGFERTFETLEDIERDAPRARDMVARFLARAVSDEVLPPAFVTDPFVRALAGGIAEDAMALLTVDRTSERLHHVWEVTGAFSVPELKRAVELLVAEFYSGGGGGVEEAVACAAGMRVPHFMHEVVFRAIATGLDRIRAEADVGATVAAATALFSALRARGVVSLPQIALGFAHARARLADLALDSPRARPHFKAFEAAAAAAGLLQEGEGEQPAQQAGARGADGTPIEPAHAAHVAPLSAQ
jgi:programmed cell death protein 4